MCCHSNRPVKFRNLNPLPPLRPQSVGDFINQTVNDLEWLSEMGIVLTEDKKEAQ